LTLKEKIAQARETENKKKTTSLSEKIKLARDMVAEQKAVEAQEAAKQKELAELSLAPKTTVTKLEELAKKATDNVVLKSTADRLKGGASSAAATTPTATTPTAEPSPLALTSNGGGALKVSAPETPQTVTPVGPVRLGAISAAAAQNPLTLTPGVTEAETAVAAAAKTPLTLTPKETAPTPEVPAARLLSESGGELGNASKISDFLTLAGKGWWQDTKGMAHTVASVASSALQANNEANYLPLTALAMSAGTGKTYEEAEKELKDVMSESTYAPEMLAKGAADFEAAKDLREQATQGDFVLGFVYDALQVVPDMVLSMGIAGLTKSGVKAGAKAAVKLSLKDLAKQAPKKIAKIVMDKETRNTFLKSAAKATAKAAIPDASTAPIGLKVFAQSYQDNLAEGVDEPTAMLAAIINAYGQSVLEGGGAQAAFKSGGLKGLVAYLKAALGEGFEEIPQDVWEGAVNKLIAGRNIPWIAEDPLDKESEGVINPARALYSGAIGTAVGGTVSAAPAISGAVNSAKQKTVEPTSGTSDIAAAVKAATEAASAEAEAAPAQAPAKEVFAPTNATLQEAVEYARANNGTVSDELATKVFQDTAAVEELDPDFPAKMNAMQEQLPWHITEAEQIQIVKSALEEKIAASAEAEAATPVVEKAATADVTAAASTATEEVAAEAEAEAATEQAAEWDFDTFKSDIESVPTLSTLGDEGKKGYSFDHATTQDQSAYDTVYHAFYEAGAKGLTDNAELEQALDPTNALTSYQQAVAYAAGVADVKNGTYKGSNGMYLSTLGTEGAKAYNSGVSSTTDTFEYAEAFNAMYEAGANDQNPYDAMVRSHAEDVMTIDQITAAYDAGGADIANGSYKNKYANTEKNNANTQKATTTQQNVGEVKETKTGGVTSVESAGQEAGQSAGKAAGQTGGDAVLRASSERGDRGNTGGERKRVALRAQAGVGEEAADQKATAVERRNNVKALSGREVSGKDLGLKNGTTETTATVVPDAAIEDDAELKEIKAELEARGFNVTFVTGDIHVSERGQSYRVQGFIKGADIVIRVDSPEFTATQLANHELFHSYIRSDPGLMARVEASIAEDFTQAEFDVLANWYASLYDGTNMSRDEIIEEMLCDAFAGMNVFDENSIARRVAQAGGAAVFTASTRRAALSNETEAGTARRTGPPEGEKFNADVNMQKTIDEYNNAVDADILERAIRIEAGEDSAISGAVSVGTVNDTLGALLKQLTGRDYSGYKIEIQNDKIDHIQKRHGKNGSADKSMRDNRDIARIGYVLANADNGKLDGKSSRYHNADGTKADKVLIEKRVNGAYIVSQVVPDTSLKTLYVITAYKNKSAVVPAPIPTNKGIPGVTSKTETQDALKLNSSVTPDAEKSNTQNKKSPGAIDNGLKLENGKIELTDGTTVEVPKDTAKFSIAFHGSPYKFDKFLLEHIGSGEGAQVHGWGLYFAKDKQVALGYQTALAKDVYSEYERTAKFKGKTLSEWQDSFERIANKSSGDTAQEYYERMGLIDELLLSGDIEAVANDSAYGEKAREWFKNTVAANWDPPGKLFTVDIPDVDVMIDEFAMFVEQPDTVQSALKKIQRRFRFGGLEFSNYDRGSDIYKKLYEYARYQKSSDEIRNDEWASKTLNEYGIKGIYYNGDKDGECYVVFDDNAVKILDEVTFDEPKFSRAFPIEETKDLIAVHNLNVPKLKEALSLGGLPMPSIAIVKGRDGWNKFGDVSLVFRKDTINPSDKRNKVYGADAWTPTTPEVGYELDTKVIKAVTERFKKIIDKRSLNMGGVNLIPREYELEKYVDNGRGDIGEGVEYAGRLKQLFALDGGIDGFKPEMTGFNSQFGNDAVEEVIAEMGEDLFLENNYLPDENRDEIIKRMRDALNTQYRADMEATIAKNPNPSGFAKKLRDNAPKELYTEDNFGYGNADSLFNDVRNYLKLRGVTSYDEGLTGSLVDEYFENDSGLMDKYKAWVREQFSGIVSRKGIRNNKDMFTASGNRRTFTQLYDDYTLDNIVKAMKASGDRAEGGFAPTASVVAAAAAKTYKSISDIKADEGRLSPLSEEELGERRKEYENTYHDILNRLLPDNSSNSFRAFDEIGTDIVEVLKKTKNPKSIYTELSKYHKKVTPEIAQEIADLANDLAEMPVNMFEAKPARAVGFNEVVAAVVPEGTDADVVSGLEDNGVQVLEYPDGDEAARLDALNSVEDVKFSRSFTHDGETYNLTEEEAAVRQQYEGTPQWLKAPNGKDTKLDAKQWLTVRTPAFKKWFGDWETVADLTLSIDTKATSTSVQEALKALAGIDLANVEEGVTAQINGEQRRKLTNNVAIAKSINNGFTEKQHLTVVKNIQRVWKHAIEVSSHKDAGDPNVTIKRFAAPILLNGEHVAYLTVKETANYGNRIYSLEMLEIEKLRGNRNSNSGDPVKTSSTAPEALSDSIIQRLEDLVNPENVSKVVDEETGEPLASAVDEYSDGAKYSRAFDKMVADMEKKQPAGITNAELTELQTKIQSLNDTNKLLAERVEHWRNETRLTKGIHVNMDEADKFAKSLLHDKIDFTKSERTKFIKDMEVLSKYCVEGGEDGEFDIFEAMRIARGPASAYVEADRSYAVPSYLEDVADDLKRRTFSISQKDRRSIPDFGQFLKDHFGRLHFANSGAYTDMEWADLQETWGYALFPEDITHPADQLQHIAWILDESEKVIEMEFTDEEVEEMIERYAQNWIDDISAKVGVTKPTFADKQKMKQLAAAEKHKQALADAKAESRDKLAAKDAEHKQKLKNVRAEYRDQLAVKGVKHQQEIKKVKDTDRERLEKLRAEKNAKLDEIKKENSTRIEELKKSLKQKREEREQKLKADFARRVQAKRTRTQETQLKGKIQRHVSRLSAKLLRPTDKKHLPEELKTTVAALLEAINLESNYTVDADGKHVKDGTGEATKRTEAFNKLKRLYVENKGEDFVLDPDLLGGDGTTGYLDDAIALADTRLVDMNLNQLNTLWNAIRGVEASIATVNKAFAAKRGETIAQMAAQLRADNEGKRIKNTASKFLGAVQKLFEIDMLRPNTFFHMLGRQGDAMFKSLREAQDKTIAIIEAAREYTLQALKDYDIDVRKLEDTKVTVTLGGEEWELTVAGLMELYNLSERDQGMAHILTGGIVLPTVKKGLMDVKQSATPVSGITEDEVRAAVALLSPGERAVADALRAYASTVLANEGNEASMRVFNYKKFTEPDYWSIRVNTNEINSKAGESASFTTPSLKNVSFAKPIAPNAKTSIYIGSVFDTFSEHLGGMATYAGYMPVLEDINRVKNYKFRDDDGNLVTTVKNLIDQVMGDKRGVSYVDTLLRDIVGNATDDSSLTGRFMRNYKAAAVGLNLRVILQQPTAIIRGMQMVNPIYFIPGSAKNVVAGWQKAVKYAPIAQWKAWGNFDVQTGKKLKEILFNSETPLEKARELSMAPASGMDSFGWGVLWNAIEAETKAKHKSLKPGTEEFYAAVAERFGEVIDNTQVVDGTLQRSQIMRSHNAINQMATAFMSEPTMQYNMFVSAMYDLKGATTQTEKNAARKKIAATVLSLAASLSVNAAVQSFVDALRDDDDELSFWEKMLAQFFGKGEDGEGWFTTHMLKGNLGSAFNPLQYIPYVKDVVSIFQGYDVSRMDMEGFANLSSAIQNVMKAQSGSGKYTPLSAWSDLFAETARLLGVPVYNVKRDVMSIVNTITGATNNVELQYKLATYTLRQGVSSNLKTYMDLLYEAKQTDPEAYKRIYDDMIARDMWGTDTATTADKIKAQMESRMKAEADTKSVKELEKRYVSPDEEAEYNAFMDEVLTSKIYTSASDADKAAMRQLANDYYDKAGTDKETDWMSDARNAETVMGISTTDYILYRSALKSVDEPEGEKGHGSYDTEEKKEAAAKVSGLSAYERDYLVNPRTAAQEKIYKPVYMELTSSAAYKALDEALKDKATAWAYDYADKKDKLATDKTYTLPSASSWIEKADAAAQMSGMSTAEYIAFMAELRAVDQPDGEKGHGSYDKDEWVEAAQAVSGLSAAEIAFLESINTDTKWKKLKADLGW